MAQRVTPGKTGYGFRKGLSIWFESFFFFSVSEELLGKELVL